MDPSGMTVVQLRAFLTKHGASYQGYRKAELIASANRVLETKKTLGAKKPVTKKTATKKPAPKIPAKKNNPRLIATYTYIDEDDSVRQFDYIASNEKELVKLILSGKTEITEHLNENSSPWTPDWVFKGSPKNLKTLEKLLKSEENVIEYLMGIFGGSVEYDFRVKRNLWIRPLQC